MDAAKQRFNHSITRVPGGDALLFGPDSLVQPFMRPHLVELTDRATCREQDNNGPGDLHLSNQAFGGGYRDGFKAGKRSGK